MFILPRTPELDERRRVELVVKLHAIYLLLWLHVDPVAIERIRSKPRKLTRRFPREPLKPRVLLHARLELLVRFDPR